MGGVGGWRQVLERQVAGGRWLEGGWKGRWLEAGGWRVAGGVGGVAGGWRVAGRAGLEGGGWRQVGRGVAGGGWDGAWRRCGWSGGIGIAYRHRTETPQYWQYIYR